MYHKGISEIPNVVMQAFDIISYVIEKDESDKVKAAKENNKNSNNKKTSR